MPSSVSAIVLFAYFSSLISVINYKFSAEVEEPPMVYGGYTNLRQAWVSNLDTIKENPSTIIDLHPQVFGSRPRIDIIHENIVWQRKYRYVVSFYSFISSNIFHYITSLTILIYHHRVTQIPKLPLR